MPLFLHHTPFVKIDVRKHEEPDYVIDNLYFEDVYKTEVERFNDTILRFMAHNDIITVVGDMQITNSTNQEMNSWIWHINWTSLRGLVDGDIYHSLFASLNNYQGEPLRKVVALYTALCVEFEPTLLNTLCHRTITAQQVIPYQTEDESKDMTWSTIHKETPYMWLLVYMQSLLIARGIPLEAPKRTPR